MPTKKVSKKPAASKLSKLDEAAKHEGEKHPHEEAVVRVCPNCQSFDLSEAPDAIGGLTPTKWTCNECGNEFYTAPELDMPKTHRARK